MTQFQIDRVDPSVTRLVPPVGGVPGPGAGPAGTHLEAGQALMRVRRFGFSANNVTYVALGDRLGYWKFFPAEGDDAGSWGVVPVWGIAEVVATEGSDLALGERLFGLFPAATDVVLTPARSPDGTVVDRSAHRAQLPAGYNAYQSLPGSPDEPAEDRRMLLFPLFLTAWALEDMLAESGWSGAAQLIVTSASSKTAIGMAQAVRAKPGAPATVGVTSERHRDFVQSTSAYTEVIGYDELEGALAHRPSVVVDLAGSTAVLSRLQRHLGEDLLRTVRVGLTHGDAGEAGGGLDLAHTETFFAPSVIARRIKDWGLAEFQLRSGSFVVEAFEHSRGWLAIDQVAGLEGLSEAYAEIREGTAAPDRGVVICV